jgi:hypothetical protein
MTPAELSAMPTIALVLDGPEGSRPLLLRSNTRCLGYPLKELKVTAARAARATRGT